MLLCAQVYDLQEYRPAPVLRRIWKNFEAQEKAGDTWAPIVRRSVLSMHHTCNCGCCSGLNESLDTLPHGTA